MVNTLRIVLGYFKNNVFNILLNLKGDFMKPSKFMSYTNSYYSTKDKMIAGEAEWQKIVKKNFVKFKKAGAIRQTVSEIWNKEEIRIREMWEYRNEESFINCQKLIEEIEFELNEKYDLKTKTFSNKGVILYENDF